MPLLGFPDSSVGKESACNAGDPGSIPGSGRSAGEGIGYPLQCSWASPVAQLVKNLPPMSETWVRSMGWEDVLEKGKATHSSFLAWRNPWTVQSIVLPLKKAEKRREAKGKGEKERYTHLNAEFQRIARRDEKAFLSDQCKEIEENNRMAKI